MKSLKYFILGVLCVFSLSASAQFTNSSVRSSSSRGSSSSSSSSEFIVKYQGDISVGAFINGSPTISFGTTQGAKIGNYFFAGVSLYGDVWSEDFGWWNLTPMLSLKGYCPLNENCRLFLNPELGATIGIAGSMDAGWWDIDNEGCAFEYRLTAGVEINSFFIGIGCGGAGSTAFLAKIGVLF